MTMLNLRPFRRALRGLIGQVLGYQVKDGFGATLVPLFERVIRGERVRDEELVDAMGSPESASPGAELQAQAAALGPLLFPPVARGRKSTALVSMRGTALYDLEVQPFAFSTLLLAQSINALAQNEEVGTIVLDIDSPGGVITGVPEAADAIWAARKHGKHVVALVNPLAASAAYWLASQADEIVAVPSGEVGAIGVFILHADCSHMMEEMGVKHTFIFAGEHKTEGNPLEPLSPDAQEHMQSQVDLIYRGFIKAVARGRGVTGAKVEKFFGQGRTYLATEALRRGLVDRISTIDGAFASFGVVGDPQALHLESVAPVPMEESVEETLKRLTTRSGPAPTTTRFPPRSEDDSDPDPEPEPELETEDLAAHEETNLVTAVCVDEEQSCFALGTRMAFYADNIPEGWALLDTVTSEEPPVEPEPVELVKPTMSTRARRLAILRTT